MVELLNQTPKGLPVTTIGIWMSGGADSSLLCYLLAKQIKETNSHIKLQPFTIDYKRPFVGIAVEVRQQIEKLLDCADIFSEHIVYHPPEGITWTLAELGEQFHIRNKQHFAKGLIQALYSGITTNPPVEVQETFNYGVLKDVEAKRGVNVPKETLRYLIVEGIEFIESKPFFEVDKRTIAKLYKEHNLLDTLFPLTRSCEHVGTVRGHCGECWWCQERQWAFEKL